MRTSRISPGRCGAGRGIRDDLVVDIGANDGTLLASSWVSNGGCRADQADAQPRSAARSYKEFFTEELAQRIVAEHGQAKVVTACNVLAHVEDIHDVMRGINVLLADNGVLVAENHDLASVVDGGQWDTVYHEHLRFFDRISFYRSAQGSRLSAIRDGGNSDAWRLVPDVR